MTIFVNNPWFPKSSSVTCLLSPAALCFIVLFGVACKQRKMNESAAPESIGAIYEGKERFLWPLVKAELTVPGGNGATVAVPGVKEVCWYAYEQNASPAGSSQDRQKPLRYSPEQMRAYFIKSSLVGGSGARYLNSMAFEWKAADAGKASSYKELAGLGSCGVWAFAPGGSAAMAAVRGLSALFCIGTIVRAVVSDPRRDDSYRDSDIAGNLEAFLNVSFFEDARIPVELHKSLMKAIEKVYADEQKKPSANQGLQCPETNQALTLVDTTARAVFESRPQSSAVP